MKNMKAKELIENNSLANVEVTGGQTVVFTEIALTAISMAREEGREEMKKKAIEAFKFATDGYFIIGGTDYSGNRLNEFIEKLICKNQ